MAILVGEGGEVVDTEINTHRLLAGRVDHLNLDFAHEVQLPLLSRPHRSNLLDALHAGEVNVGAGLVLTEDEVRPVVLEV